MVIGFLGTGRIAVPMVKALTGAGHEIVVSARSHEASSELAARCADVRVADNQEVVAASDVVFICLLADVARRELASLPFRADHRVVSVMAEFPLAEIAGLIGETVELCVTIPMPFIDHGGCPLATYPASATLASLFGADNAIIEVETEAGMGPHFAATALTSTMLKAMMTVRDWLGEQTGDTAAAERYMLLLESGYLSALPRDGQGRLDEAVGHLATAGGLNAQLLEHMEKAGTMRALEQGLSGLVNRRR